MKIAVTFENGEVFQHFGHTETFKLYEVEGDQIVSSEVIPTNGSGHDALAGFLSDLSAYGIRYKRNDQAQIEGFVPDHFAR